MSPPAVTNEAIDRTQTLGPRGEGAGATTGPLTSGAEPALGDDEARVDDRYELLAEHGRGGLGRVMRARDRRLGRLVAVKELLRTSDLAQQLFVREAMITARLEHPGIVPVHEAGRWASGDPYYVMKLVSGRTLKEVMTDAGTLHDRLALLPHLIAVAEAVGYAHSEQVVHRDLKPTNVLVGEFGETVVIDWGLARDLRVVDAVPMADAVAGSPVGVCPTVTGRVVGTPQYMSPEQARGEAVGPAADVYAVGAMLYELLAGRPPIEGDSVKSLLDQVHAGPPRALASVAPEVPADLEAVVTKAMARSARDRYPTARELAADLKRFQTGQLVTAQRYGTWRLLRRWVVRRRGYVAMAAIAGAAIAAVAIAMLVRVFDERRVAEARRAEAEVARAAAEAGEHELIAAQARAALATDPTTALAWLKRYPIGAATAAPLRTLIDEAEAAGVARHVWPLGDRPRGLALSPDGRRVAVGQSDGYVRVYDTDTGAVRLLGDGGAPITAVAQSASGAELYVADARGRLAMLDAATGARTELAAIAGTVEGLVGLPSGAVLIHTADSWLLRDPRTGVVAALYPAGRKNEHLTEAIDRARGEVRVGHGADGGVRVWRGDRPAALVATVPGIPHHLAVTADGKVALVATTAALYRVDLTAGAVARILDLSAELYQITIDHHDRRAAVVGKGNDVYVVDLATGAVDVKRGHKDGVFMAAFDERGDRLVTAGDEGTVRVWDLGTGDVRELRGHKDDVVTVAIASDGRTVLSTSYDDTMRLWRLDDRRTTVVGPLDDVRAVAAMGGDRVRVLSVGAEARVVDIDLATRATEVLVSTPTSGTMLNFLSPDGRSALFRRSPTEAILWRDGVTRTLRFSTEIVSAKVARDGRTVIGVDEAGVVTRQDERGTFRLAQASPGAAAGPSSDGRTVLVRDRLGFRVLDLETGAERAALGRAELGLNETAMAWFLPDDPRVAITGNPDADVGMRVWDPGRGTLVTLADSRYAHPGIVVSPDGRWLAGGVESRALRLWDAATGATRTTLRGHRDGVFAQAFSPDGTRLATASYDRTVRIWDLATGDSRVLSGHVGPVWSVAWLDDGQVVSASADGTVRRWAVPPLPAADARELRRRLDALTAVEVGDDHRALSPVRR
ncbi:MAG: protein kinase [Myxococcales bacterium]|nr:protein kinase [Myxococcales bacterium]